MKKILSFVLCAFLALGCFVFSACGNDGYNIAGIEDDYKAIAENSKYISLDNSKYLVFDFSSIENSDNFGNEDKEKFLKPLNDYYQVLSKNSLNFIVYSLPAMKTASLSKDTSNLISDQLSELNTKAVAIGNQIESFTWIVENTLANTESADREYRFSLLTNAFCEYYEACRVLSATLSITYFNNVIPDININYFTYKEDYASKLKASLKDLANFQIYNLTQNYIETNVDGSTVEKIEETFSSYSTAVTNLLDSIAKMAEYTVLQASDELHGYAVTLFNLNSQILNESEMYVNACNSIQYVVVSGNELTYEDTCCVSVINGYTQLLNEYNTNLLKIFNSLSKP